MSDIAASSSMTLTNPYFTYEHGSDYVNNSNNNYFNGELKILNDFIISLQDIDHPILLHISIGTPLEELYYEIKEGRLLGNERHTYIDAQKQMCPNFFEDYEGDKSPQPPILKNKYIKVWVLITYTS